MNKTLTINISTEKDRVILNLSGRLDTLGARELDTTIQHLCGYPDLNLILNMKDIIFLSSAGIRLLIKYIKQCEQSGKQFKLTDVSPQAADVLKMVGLEQLLPDKIQNTAQDGLIESVNDHIHFQLHQLHEEPANLISHSPNSKIHPFPLQAYDLLIGRDRAGYEFFSWNNRIVSENQEVFMPAYCIGTHGSPSHLISFAPDATEDMPLTTLLKNLLRLSNSRIAGLLLRIDSARLVGLYKDNEQSMLTTSPVYTPHSLWIAGIIQSIIFPETSQFTRLLSPDGSLSGHLHAALYAEGEEHPPLKDTHEQLEQFPSTQASPTVLHLLYDDRPTEGCGESRVGKGSAWIIKVR